MNILFLCTHNACRSILAEAIARQGLGELANVASAGSAPRGEVHPDALAALARHGYATESLRSTDMHSAQELQPEVVISVCDQAAGEACPIWLRDAARVSWGMPDPSRAPDSDRERAFDNTIAVLEQRIDALRVCLQSLPPGAERIARIEAIAREYAV